MDVEVHGVETQVFCAGGSVMTNFKILLKGSEVHLSRSLTSKGQVDKSRSSSLCFVASAPGWSIASIHQAVDEWAHPDAELFTRSKYCSKRAPKSPRLLTQGISA